MAPAPGPDYGDLFARLQGKVPVGQGIRRAFR
jgi:hypothetical protein